jgi:hypothetical protein
VIAKAWPEWTAGERSRNACAPVGIIVILPPSRAFARDQIGNAASAREGR